MNMVKSHLLSRSTLSSAIIGVVPKEVGTNSKDAHDNEDRTSMHQVGTAGIVVQVTGTNWPRPAYTLLVTGLCRFRLENLAVSVIVQLRLCLIDCVSPNSKNRRTWWESSGSLTNCPAKRLASAMSSLPS